MGMADFVFASGIIFLFFLKKKERGKTKNIGRPYKYLYT